MQGPEKAAALFLLIFALLGIYAYNTGGINSSIINHPVVTPQPTHTGPEPSGGWPTPTPTPTFPPLPNSTNYNWGVNYQGKNWHFTELNSTILNRDFDRFQAANMKQIIFPVYWSAMETSNNSWNSPQYVALHNWVSLANSHNIKVIIDFHTLTGGTSWTIPLWISSSRNFDYNTVVTYRNDWLHYINYTTAYLSDLQIDTYQLCNEPMIGALGVSTSTFIDFVNDTKIQVLDNDSTNVSIRFNIPALIDLNYNATLLNMLDFVGVHFYLQYWVNHFGSYSQAINYYETSMSHLTSYDVFMDEFGDNRVSDALQVQNYQDMLNEFLSYNNVIGGAAWWYKPNAPLSYSAYNLIQDNGNVRPAFNVLSNANNP